MSYDFRNFGLMIPNDVVRRDDGQPALYIKYKREFIKAMIDCGKIEEIEKMSWAERDEEYKKWEIEFLKTNNL